MELADWEGNGVADHIAKWAARKGSPPAEIVRSRCEQRQLNEQVARAAGTVLLQRLRARQRTAKGSAVKVTKRRPPGLPRRLREAKRPRKLIVGEAEQELQLGDLLQLKARAQCTPEQARELVWAGGEPAEGLHH